jgi:hypothetical protein
MLLKYRAIPRDYLPEITCRVGLWSAWVNKALCVVFIIKLERHGN